MGVRNELSWSKERGLFWMSMGFEFDGELVGFGDMGEWIWVNIMGIRIRVGGLME